MSPVVSRAVRIFSTTAIICRDSPTVSRSITGQTGMIKVRPLLNAKARPLQPSGVGHPLSPPHSVHCPLKSNPCCYQSKRHWASLTATLGTSRPEAHLKIQTEPHKLEMLPPGGAKESLLISSRRSTWCPQHRNGKAVSLHRWVWLIPHSSAPPPILGVPRTRSR